MINPPPQLTINTYMTLFLSISISIRISYIILYPSYFFFFLNEPAPPEIYPLPLPAALPIPLQAADDLLLRQPLLPAPPDVAPRGGRGAHPSDHAPPQGMVGLAVTARVEPAAGDFPR